MKINRHVVCFNADRRTMLDSTQRRIDRPESSWRQVTERRIEAFVVVYGRDELTDRGVGLGQEVFALTGFLRLLTDWVGVDGGASKGISLLAIGEPRPVQASQPGPDEKAPLLPSVMS